MSDNSQRPLPARVRRAFRDDVEDGDDSDEPKTDPGFRVDAAYLKEKLRLEATALEESLRKHDNKLTLRSIAVAIVAVATGVIAGILFIDNRVAAGTDAGVRILQAEQKGLDARVTTVEKRIDRMDDKLDLLLDAARVPQWKRPQPVDGGPP